MLGMYPRRIGLLALAAFAVFLALPTGLFAQLRSPLFYDFDGDGTLDRAELVAGGAHKSIELNLSSTVSARLSFEAHSNGDGFLVAIDIDRDKDLDLVWVIPSEPQSSIVWLGDGHGHFEIAGNSASYLGQLASVLGCNSPQSFSTSAPEKRGACTAGAAFLFVVSGAQGRLPVSRSVRVAGESPEFNSCINSREIRGPPLSTLHL